MPLKELFWNDPVTLCKIPGKKVGGSFSTFLEERGDMEGGWRGGGKGDGAEMEARLPNPILQDSALKFNVVKVTTA